MFWSKPKKISFENAQQVLGAVLRDVRCNEWADRVASVSSSSFKSLLGGMGSLTDLVISQENQHEVSTEREPLANELVHCLTSVCVVTSRGGAVTADAAVGECGDHSLLVSGWRCLACGYGRISLRGARCVIAALEVRRALKEGIAQRSPTKALLDLWEHSSDSDLVQALVAKAQASGVRCSEEESWMRPCPGCGSDDTCVYRWRQENDRLLPEGDNLPLRNSSGS